MRIAFFCPSAPKHSPLVAYAQALVPLLAAEHEVTLILGPVHPHEESMPLWYTAGETLPYEAWWAAPERFDVTFYQFGDPTRLQGFMFQALQRHPGIVILHSMAPHQALLKSDVARLESVLTREDLSMAFGPEKAHSHWPLLLSILEPSLAVIAAQERIAYEVKRLCPPAFPVEYIPPPLLPEREAPIGQWENLPLQQTFSDRALFFVGAPPERTQDAALFRRAMEDLSRRWPQTLAIIDGTKSVRPDFYLSLFDPKTIWWANDLSLEARRCVLTQARAALFFAPLSSEWECLSLAQPLAYGVPVIVIGRVDESPWRHLVITIAREHPQNWALLSATLDYILTYPERLERFGTLGKHLVFAHYSPERTQRTLRALLARLTEERPSIGGTLWPKAFRERLAARESLSVMAGQALAELGFGLGDPHLRGIAEVIESLALPEQPAENELFAAEKALQC